MKIKIALSILLLIAGLSLGKLALAQDMPIPDFSSGGSVDNSSGNYGTPVDPTGGSTDTSSPNYGTPINPPSDTTNNPYSSTQDPSMYGSPSSAALDSPASSNTTAAGDTSASAPSGNTSASAPKGDTSASAPKGDTKFTGIGNPLQAGSVQEILSSIVDLALFIGVIIAVLMFIFIGFKFVMARGNSTELAEARKWFLYAVIGTAILISAKVIVEVIKSTLVSTGVVNQQLFNK